MDVAAPRFENYFCTEGVLMAWAIGTVAQRFLRRRRAERRVAAMRYAIDEVTHTGDRREIALVARCQGD